MGHLLDSCASPVGNQPFFLPDSATAPPDPVAAQAVWVICIVFVDLKGVPIVSVQPILGTEPQESLLILDHTGNHALGEALV